MMNYVIDISKGKKTGAEIRNKEQAQKILEAAAYVYDGINSDLSTYEKMLREELGRKRPRK